MTGEDAAAKVVVVDVEVAVVPLYARGNGPVVRELEIVLPVDAIRVELLAVLKSLRGIAKSGKLLGLERIVVGQPLLVADIVELRRIEIIRLPDCLRREVPVFDGQAGGRIGKEIDAGRTRCKRYCRPRGDRDKDRG